MSSFEVFESGGIVVARQLIDPAILTDAASEGHNLVDKAHPYILTTGTGSPAPVESTTRGYGSLGNHPAIAKVVDCILGSEASTARVQANRQGPFAFQRFHPDPRKNPVAIVHANDEGAFDYARAGVATNPVDRFGDDGHTTEYFPDEFETIKLGAGDVLVQIDTSLIHRGRNESDADRITLGVYTS